MTIKPEIRVAMLAQNYLPHLGGAERQMAALAPLLLQRGVAVTILTRQCEGATVKLHKIDGVTIYRSPVTRSRALTSILFTLRCQWWLFRLKPDVIHSQELLSPTTAALVAQKLYKIPVVAKILRGGYLGDIYKVLRRTGGSRRMRYLANNVERFISISDEIVQELEQQSVKEINIARIPNGVDTDKYSPCDRDTKKELCRKLGLTEGPVVLFAGRLSEEKNIDLLLRVWPRVRAEFEDAKLLIVGDGEQHDELQQLVTDNVELRASVDDLSDLYRAASVFVLPSKTEGMSNALLEAMASGCVCVASEVGAAPDLIRHRVNGFLSAVNDADALTDCLNEALSSDGRQLGQNARETIQSSYSLHRVADQLVSLYKSVGISSSDKDCRL